MINGGKIYTDIFFFRGGNHQPPPAPPFQGGGIDAEGRFGRGLYRQLTTPSEVSKAVSAAIIICKIALTISFFIVSVALKFLE